MMTKVTMIKVMMTVIVFKFILLIIVTTIKVIAHDPAFGLARASQY